MHFCEIDGRALVVCSRMLFEVLVNAPRARVHAVWDAVAGAV